MVSNCLFKTVHFAEIKQWNAKQFFQTNIKSKYIIDTIGNHTFHITKKTKLFDEPEKEHKILGISNETGMFDAYSELGKNIKQPYIYVENGCLAYNPYRINIGSIGLKTDKLNNEYISPAYVVFKCKETILPEYPYLVLKSTICNSIIREKTTGSVRQTLSYDNLASIRIPIPPIDIQQTLLFEYNTTIFEAQKIEDRAAKTYLNNEKYLMNMLNLNCVEASNNAEILKFVSYKQLVNKWEWDSFSEMIDTSIKDCIYPVKTLGQALTFANRPWKKTNCSTDKFMYIEIGGINAIDNIATANEVLIADAPSRATQTVEGGDLIIGTTRPYLKRFALIQDFQGGYVCSSGFQIIKKNPKYDLRYITEVLKLDPIIKQFEALMTGALYPAINAEQLKQVRIPIPPIEIQRKIANHIEKKKERGKNYYQQANTLREYAKKKFEEAIFDET